MGKRRSLLCRIKDHTGTFVSALLSLFPPRKKSNWKPVNEYRCFGEIRRGSTGFEIYHPEYKVIGEDETQEETAQSDHRFTH